MIRRWISRQKILPVTDVMKMKNIKQGIWDVVIVGAGPAGSAAASKLAKAGWRVLMLEKHAANVTKFGESLAPLGLGILEQVIGTLDGPNADRFGLRDCAGNLSSWHTPELHIQDFFYTPEGRGLCIDRSRFDVALANLAHQNGVEVLKPAQFVQCHRAHVSDNWSVEIKHHDVHEWLTCRYLIDASGRNSVLANHLGVEKHQLDNLFAFGLFVEQNKEAQTQKPDSDRFTRLEAVSDGWWYSNKLPINDDADQDKSKRVLVFHTDLDIAEAKQAATLPGFIERLKSTDYLESLIKHFGYEMVSSVRGAPASTGRLDTFSGEGWFAVGDAAMTFDPLSSQGMTKAMTAGLFAADLIHSGLRNIKENGHRQSDEFLSKRFLEEQEKVWQTYQREYNYNYSMQRRWSSHPFWARRHQTHETEQFREAP